MTGPLASAIAAASDGNDAARAMALPRPGTLRSRHPQRRRDQDHAAEGEARHGLQRLRQARPTKAAVALAHEDPRRVEPAVGLQPPLDEDGERVDIALHRPELRAHRLVLAVEAAVAGAHRIDEDEVGEVEPGLGVGQQIGRRRRVHDRRRDGEPPWPERAQVQPSRGRPRPAVDDEGDGAPARLRAVDEVGEVAHLGHDDTFRVLESHGTRLGREGQGAVGQGEAVPAHRLGRQRRLGLVGGGGPHPAGGIVIGIRPGNGIELADGHFGEEAARRVRCGRPGGLLGARAAAERQEAERRHRHRLPAAPRRQYPHGNLRDSLLPQPATAGGVHSTVKSWGSQAGVG